ncbi:unnamed protein product [Pylaiella littoralis]
MEKQAKMHIKISDERTKSDTRTLTVLELQKAVRCLLRGEPIDPATRQKCEKDDYRMYGIRVGIKVTSQDLEKTGEIIAVKMDEKDCFNKFTIRWGQTGGGKIEQYSTHDVLRDADKGQDGVSLLDDEDRFGVFVLAVLCMVFTHVHYFIAHNDKIKRKYHCVALGEDENQDTMDLRKYVWEQTKGAAAADTLNGFELGMLKSDAGVVDELKEEKSCLKMMGLEHSDVTASSLLFRNKRFHSTHIPLVNHFVRGAQAAWKLGRLVSMESCMAPLSANELKLPRQIER